MAEHWTEDEVAAAVDGYLQMLGLEVGGRAYSKSEVNLQLRQGALVARSKKSVEYRMMNISGVLEDLGLRRIAGYPPAAHIGPTVRRLVLRILGKRGYVDPDDYEPTTDNLELESRSRRLRRRGFESPPSGRKNPEKVKTSRNEVPRDPAVRAWVLLEAEGVCELCQQPAPFRDRHDDPFLEVHHLQPLGKGGPDTVENAVGVCPNCHRRCHYSADAKESADRLLRQVDRLRRFSKSASRHR
ncbi:MAG: HNH endonuclease [Armatimonadetes bacterium]|nr:HNH endonuclease [Armatimonadota bacterium]